MKVLCFLMLLAVFGRQESLVHAAKVTASKNTAETAVKSAAKSASKPAAKSAAKGSSRLEQAKKASQKVASSLRAGWQSTKKGVQRLSDRIQKSYSKYSERRAAKNVSKALDEPKAEMPLPKTATASPPISSPVMGDKPLAAAPAATPMLQKPMALTPTPEAAFKQVSDLPETPIVKKTQNAVTDASNQTTDDLITDLPETPIVKKAQNAASEKPADTIIAEVSKGQPKAPLPLKTQEAIVESAPQKPSVSVPPETPASQQHHDLAHVDHAKVEKHIEKLKQKPEHWLTDKEKELLQHQDRLKAAAREKELRIESLAPDDNPSFLYTKMKRFWHKWERGDFIPFYKRFLRNMVEHKKENLRRARDIGEVKEMPKYYREIASIYSRLGNKYKADYYYLKSVQMETLHSNAAAVSAAAR